MSPPMSSSPSILLLLCLITAPAQTAASIWSFDIDNSPAPPPSQGPPLSASAVRDPSRLWVDVVCIVGAYLLSQIFLLGGLLTFGRRLRQKKLRESTGAVEGEDVPKARKPTLLSKLRRVKPAQLKASSSDRQQQDIELRDLKPSNSRLIKETQLRDSVISSTAGMSTPAPAPTPVRARFWSRMRRRRGNGEADNFVPLTPKTQQAFDESVVREHRNREAKDLERLYAAVYEHEEQQEEQERLGPQTPRVVYDIEEQKKASTYGPAAAPPLSPVELRFMREQGLPSPRDGAWAGRVSFATSNSGDGSDSEDDAELSDAESIPVTRQPPMVTGRQFTRIQKPQPLVLRDEMGSSVLESRQTPTLASWKPPGVAESSMDAIARGSRQSLPISPAPPAPSKKNGKQRKIPSPIAVPSKAQSSSAGPQYHSSSSNKHAQNQELPLRTFANTNTRAPTSPAIPQSAPPTKTTILQHPRDPRLSQLRSPGGPATARAAVPQSPYSPYMPFTPLSPMTPRNVPGRAELRAQMRLSRRKVLDEEDLVKGDDEMWG